MGETVGLGGTTPARPEDEMAKTNRTKKPAATKKAAKKPAKRKPAKRTKRTKKAAPEPHNKLPADELVKALETSGGIITDAAKILGVTPRGLRRRVKGDQALQRVLDETREDLVDQAESGLLANILKGNVTAQIFALKCLGKDRGWIEKPEESAPIAPQEINVNVGVAIREIRQELALDGEFRRIARKRAQDSNPGHLRGGGEQTAGPVGESD